jgi:hypothetical protein
MQDCDGKCYEKTLERIKVSTESFIPRTKDANMRVGVCHPILHSDLMKVGSLVEGPDLSDVLDLREGWPGLHLPGFLAGTKWLVGLEGMFFVYTE